MQYVSIYEKAGETAEQIVGMNFWQERTDFVLDKQIIRDEKKLMNRLQEQKPDILMLIADTAYDCTPELTEQIRNAFSGIHIIVIGNDNSYELVRGYFLAGAFDYLIQPLDIEMLKSAVLRVYADFGIAYVVNELSMKTEALINHIFLGGGQERYIINSIMEQIYADWKEDPLNCQIVSDKAKKHIYEILSERKPWLEKFLYRNDFTYRYGFTLRTKEEIVENWIECFKEASAIVAKYQMIDDKLVYRIGKYVVVHVDEKLSLKDVANGVFLNPSYVSHIFKKVTGMSFSAFMTEVKIDRAKVLLRDSKIRICDVAATVGYSNPEYFTKNFKSNTGYAPIEYQRMQEERHR